MCSQVLEHLVSNNLLHYTQDGFTTHRSTCTNLLESLNDWTLCLQDRQHVSVVYIDFSKAFDVVSHNKLFARLNMVLLVVYCPGCAISILGVHTALRSATGFLT